jgi:DNA polymerase-4
MQWPRAIVHVDMDAFFVSVERRNDPSLEDKPVIVGGGPGGRLRRGVVAACSYETRRFGVRSAMPLVQAVRLCPQAILIPVGRSDYGAATRQVRAVLESFTDRVEMTSPDEAYVDLEGTRLLHGAPIEAAHRLRERIRNEVDLPVSIGLATTRTHAKIASKLSKPRGMFVVAPGAEGRIVRPLPLRALPGLGPKTAERLGRAGLRTLGEMIDAGEGRLVALLGDWGADLRRRALGESVSSIQPDRERAQISSEETFAEDIGDPARLDAELARMTMRVGRRLRRAGKLAGVVTIKLRTPDFATTTRQAPLAPPTNDDRTILRAARELVRRHWRDRAPLRLLGVGVTHLTETRQGDFIVDAGGAKGERLCKTMDALRERAGDAGPVWGAAFGEIGLDSQ